MSPVSRGRRGKKSKKRKISSPSHGAASYPARYAAERIDPGVVTPPQARLP